MWLAAMRVAPAKGAAFAVATNVAGKDAEQGCAETVSALIQNLLR